MSRRAWIILGVVLGLWVLFVAVVAVGFVGAFVGFVAGGVGTGPWDEEPILGDGASKVAIIRVAGEIHGGESGGGPFESESAGAKDILSQIRQAEEDPDVGAVIVQIDSPGGAVVASDEIATGLDRLRGSVPVIASMGDIAASGGYYIASATDHIVANEATITGSIGVIMMLPNLEGSAEKLGIRVRVIKSGEFKDAGSPFRELSPEEQAHFQRLIDEAYGQFVGVVAAGREMPEDEVRRIADGRIYSGRQAHDLGLVDTFGSLETAYEIALDRAGLSSEDARLVEYRASGGFGLFPPFLKSPVDEVKRELGIGFGLKYLYLP